MIVDIKYLLFYKNIASIEWKDISSEELELGYIYTIKQFRSRSFLRHGRWRKAQDVITDVDFRLNKDGTIPKRIDTTLFPESIKYRDWKLNEFYEILFNDHGIKYEIDRVRDELIATGNIQDFFIISKCFEPKTHLCFVEPILKKIEEFNNG